MAEKIETHLEKIIRLFDELIIEVKKHQTTQSNS